MTTIEIYKKMLAYLLDNNMADDYACIARRSGINEVQISRVRNGKVKRVKEETMRKLNTTYGNIFNPEWMRGESEVMLVADLTPPIPGVNTGIPQYAQQESSPDMSSLINTIIAANDKAITSLNRELEAKEEIIDELHARISDKEEIIKHQEKIISTLEKQLYEMQLEKGASAGRYPTGAADREPATASR